MTEDLQDFKGAEAMASVTDAAGTAIQTLIDTMDAYIAPWVPDGGVDMQPDLDDGDAG